MAPTSSGADRVVGMMGKLGTGSQTAIRRASRVRVRGLRHDPRPDKVFPDLSGHFWTERAVAIRLEVLGGLRVVKDGTELTDLPRQRLRCALFTYLALERSAPRERLLHLFWPDRDPARGRRTLSQMLYELKQSLGEGWLDLRPDQVFIGDEVSVDALDFTNRVRAGDVDGAARAYAGAFLDAIHLADSHEFELWVDQQRSRLAADHRDVQRARFEQRFREGDLNAALSVARRWVLADPLDDEAQQRLIELLARCGLRNEAIRQYDEYRDRLGQLDFEPLETVTELVERLRRGELSTEVPAPLGTTGDVRLRARTGVVVFPILDLSPDRSNEYFCHGLAEEISFALGRMPGLRVVPRTSAFAFKEPGVRVREAARQLGVTHAVEGSARFDGERYRVGVALIEAEQEVELWRDQFDGRLGSSDVFDLQDQIAGSVIGALEGRVALAEPPSRPPPERPLPPRRVETADPEAYALYLQGRHAWFGRTLDGLEEALKHFRAAIEVDARYARAYAGVADVYCVLGGYDYAPSPPTELYPLARTAGERAIELDPESSEGHAALGNYYMYFAWDWEQAERHLLRAITLNPGYSTARQWYSNWLIHLGREDEALAEATLALELDPRSVFLASSLARHFQLMRKPQRAVEQYRRALAIEPSFQGAHLGLALAELQAGRADSALERLRRLDDASGSEVPLVLALIAYALGVSGDHEGARAATRRLKATSAAFLPPEFVALAYTGLGEIDRALDWLERAEESRSTTLVLLKVEPVFDPLRGSPRFEELTRRVGL